MASVENSLCCGSNLKEQCQNPQAQNDLFMPAQRSNSLAEDSGDVCISFSPSSLLLLTPAPFHMKHLTAEGGTAWAAALTCPLHASHCSSLALPTLPGTQDKQLVDVPGSQTAL